LSKLTLFITVDKWKVLLFFLVRVRDAALPEILGQVLYVLPSNNHEPQNFVVVTGTKTQTKNWSYYKFTYGITNKPKVFVKATKTLAGASSTTSATFASRL
jgi:hypothetical protein